MSFADKQLAEDLGQLLIVGFDAHTPNDHITKLIRDYHVGNVILFVRNVKDSQQLSSLTRSLQQIAKDAGHKRPLFISIDQENGLVSRVGPPLAPQFPGAMTLGAVGGTQAAYDVGVATARHLRHHGVQYDYAPVADINSNPKNPVVGVRSFGDDAVKVGQFASAAAKGLKHGKVVACFKHFPGHGDTAVDSHHGTALINKPLSELQKCELVPFRQGVLDDVDSVMIAHVIIPALGDDLPCSISPSATRYLKRELGYKGLVITDCLEMDAISVPYTSQKAAGMALAAGSDCIMICHEYDRQVGGLQNMYEQVSSGKIPRQQVQESLQKVNALKDKYLSWEDALAVKPALDTSVYDADVALAKKAYNASTTVIRLDSASVPFRAGETIGYVTPGKPRGHGASAAVNIRTDTTFIPPSFVTALESRGVKIVPAWYGPDTPVSQHDADLAHVDRILVISRNAGLLQFQQPVMKHLVGLGKPVACIAVDVPYDYLHDPEVSTYICTYEPSVEAFDSALDIVFGEKTTATGKCPVSA